MNWIKKHSTAIIIVLVVLLGMKSCQSCSRARQIEYNTVQYEMRIDSMSQHNNIYMNKCRQLSDTVSMLRMEIQSLNKQLGRTEEYLQSSQRLNNNLVNTIKQDRYEKSERISE